MKMSAALKKHITKFIRVTEADLTGILSYFKPIEVKKKQNLLEAGKVSQQLYFVEKGCLRLFFINEKGTEQTIEFALEGWWMTDHTSFSNQTPADFYVQAVETSKLLSIDHPSHQKLLDDFPVMEKYFRHIYQRARAAAQHRVKYLYELSREESYHHFSQHYPEFVQRIPQYLLASFLGFTPEYLSEIRRKKIS